MIAGIFLMLSASILSQPLQQDLSTAHTRNHPLTLSQTASSQNRAAKITVPFEYFKRHIYITANVDGRPGLIFMLDSGANENILNLRTAHLLGIQPENIVRESNVGFAGGRIDVGGEQAVRAEIGSTKIANAMTVMDLTPFERRFGHPTDGMLGAPFLQRFVVKLDFQNKLLTLSPAQHYTYHGPGESVRLRGNSTSIVIPVVLKGSEFDSRSAGMEVDTGSNANVLLYRHCVSRLHLEQSVSSAHLGQGYGVNGDFRSIQGAINSIGIADAEAYNLPVDYFEPAQTIHPKCQVAGAIGNGILQSFQAVIFDVRHRQIIFEVVRKPVQVGAMEKLRIIR